MQQVVQFHCWKAPGLESAKLETSEVVRLSQSQRERNLHLKSSFVKDLHLLESVFSNVACAESSQNSFNWADFSVAATLWEDYSRKLHKELVMSFPHWRTHHSIFNVSFDEK